MSEYKVIGGCRHDRLADAKADAEKRMTGRHSDYAVLIFKKRDGEDFFKPYAKLVRQDGKFVLKR